jgi:uncharacterized protein (TIGR02145 family)
MKVLKAIKFIMLTKNFIRISVLFIISILLYSCKTEEVVVNGDINGLVTDAETSDPIQGVLVKSMQSSVMTDTTRTLMDGSYLLKNLVPGDYDIQASKNGYATGNIENVKVFSSVTTEHIDFSLNKISTPYVSNTILDFGLDSTSLKFYISKTGTGILTYNISASQNWITFSSTTGEILNITDTNTVTVNIDRTGLAKSKYKETIKITQIIGSEVMQEVNIDVYLNGIWIDSKYVNIVRIGTQVWMGENLNVGTRIDGAKDQTDNNKLEKYCYNDGEYNCDIYGGLYQWDEMMQYNPPEDTGTIIGTTQGICPEGWHIPTDKEWRTLAVYLGGEQIAGGKMKETGTIHWTPPNTGATNESGFTGLPGGWRYFEDNEAGFWMFGIEGAWWSAFYFPGMLNAQIGWWLNSKDADFTYSNFYDVVGASVRCVKDP